LSLDTQWARFDITYGASVYTFGVKIAIEYVNLIKVTESIGSRFGEGLVQQQCTVPLVGEPMFRGVSWEYQLKSEETGKLW
jgi:hypothetical protein